MLRCGRLAVGLALVVGASVSFAQTVTLANNGSTVLINAGSSTSTPYGVYDWRTGPGGPNWVNQQVYGIRVSTGIVRLVNDISAPTITQPIADLATISYVDPVQQFELSFRYLLSGAPPSSSDLAEVVTLRNTGAFAQIYSLFEYDFFTPGGVMGGTGTLLNSSTIQHANGFGSVTVGATPIPNAWMIDTSANVLNQVLIGNLQNFSSPFTNGDVAFAFQWDIRLNPGETYQMSKNKILAVPEPASLTVLGLAVVAALRRLRKS